MKSKKSFFNMSIIKQDFRQNGWIGIAYLLCLLFAVPLEILQLSSQEYVIFKDYQNYFFINTDLQIIFLFIIPVAAGLLLFRYIQNEASVDMIHSLPIRREAIFFNHLISGLLLLILPVIVTSITTFFVTKSVKEFNSILTGSELLSWTGIYLLMTCLLFCITITIGMMTGMSSAQAILTYIFLFLPVGLVTLIIYNFSFLLYGFSSAFIEKKIEYLSLFIRYLNINSYDMPFTAKEILIYTFITLILIFIGLMLYKARHLERATDVIVFPLLRPIFKYGMTLCSMLLGGTYFYSTTNGVWGWLIFGYISGAFLGYIIAEMILQKSWRIFHIRAFTGLIGFSIIVIIILGVIKTDLLNFEKKIPSLDEVSEVYFGNSYLLNDFLDYKDYDIFSESKEYIEAVRSLHQSLIDDKEFILSKRNDSSLNSQDMIIAYRLENGKILSREYNLPLQFLEDELKPIMDSKEYKKSLPEFLQLQNETRSIEFESNDPIAKQIVINDKNEINELKQILEEELLNMTVNDFLSPSPAWGYISLNGTQIFENSPLSGYPIDWLKSFNHLSSWLDKHGYLSDAHININHIKQAQVTMVDENLDELEIYDIEEIYPMGETVHTITDKAVLTELLEKSIDAVDYPSQNKYYIKFTLTNGTHWFVTIANDRVPKEVSDLFNQ